MPARFRQKKFCVAEDAGERIVQLVPQDFAEAITAAIRGAGDATHEVGWQTARASQALFDVGGRFGQIRPRIGDEIRGAGCD